mgnify:CR=1 FL=1
MYFPKFAKKKVNPYEAIIIIRVDKLAPAEMNFHPVLSVFPKLYKVLIARIRLMIITHHFNN